MIDRDLNASYDKFLGELNKYNGAKESAIRLQGTIDMTENQSAKDLNEMNYSKLELLEQRGQLQKDLIV